MTTFAPNPGNETLPLGPFLGYIADQPILNTGFFAQFTSGRFLGDEFKLVLGLRADRFAFNYYPTGEPGTATAAKS